MSDEPHRAAILALLDGVIAQPVHDGVVPPGASRPYLLVYTSLETIEQSSLAGLSDASVMRIYCHGVGDTAAAAAIVAASAQAALLNQRPAVAGRICGPIRQEVALPPDRDETTGELVMDAISQYWFPSWPA